MLDLNSYIFKNRLTGYYWIEKGKYTSNKNEATKFNSEQAARFFRKVKNPNQWIKEKA